MNRCHDAAAGRRARGARILAASLASVAVALCSVERPAHADPLRLRSDVYAQSSDNAAPVGMLVVRGDDKLQPWVDAEAVAWLGVTDGPGVTGDVQTLTVRVRDPGGRGEVRVGRFLETTGAIMPLHLDGIRALGRAAETGTTLELFGGSPVVPRFASRDYDYAIGGRVGQAVSTWMNLGVAYVMRRANGELLDQEFGPDLAIAPNSWFDLAAHAAWDLVHASPTDALASMSFRKGDFRVELFGTRRTPGRLLPATSLFSVLGDYAATTSGGTIKYRAFPRLDLLLTGATIYQTADESANVGAYATARATLALDDAWAGNLGIELKRQSLDNARWSGVRAIAGVPIVAKFRFAAEFELVRFDDAPDGTTSRYRPWGLLALSYHGFPHWDFAGALEASRTRDAQNEYYSMLRATYAFEQTK